MFLYEITDIRNDIVRTIVFIIVRANVTPHWSILVLSWKANSRSLRGTNSAYARRGGRMRETNGRCGRRSCMSVLGTARRSSSCTVETKHLTVDIPYITIYRIILTGSFGYSTSDSRQSCGERHRLTLWNAPGNKYIHRYSKIILWIVLWNGLLDNSFDDSTRI